MTAKAIVFKNRDDAGLLVREYPLPLNKLDATAAPGTSNDDTQGYVAGSVWADRTNDKVYLCTDNATGAATWVEAGSGGGGSGDVTAASAFGTDNRVIRSDGTGKGVQASTVTIEDTGDMTVTGTIAASNLSGTNTGDQTITLTGDVTGSGTGSFAATISNDAVTFAKMQDIATDKLLGRSTAGSGNVEEITCTSFGRDLLDDASVAAQRTTLGGTTVGQAYFTLANPSAVTFPRMNADNTVTALSASAFLAAIGGIGSANLKWTESSKSADWTVTTDTNVLYRVSLGGGNVTATLPTYSGNGVMVIAFKVTIQSSTYTLTIDGNSSEDIDGALTCVLRSLNDCVILACDGASGWRIIADNREKNWTVSAKSSAFTAGVVTNTAYHCDVSGASFTATLPAASGNAGLVQEFKLTTAPGGNTLTIDGNASETIDGATTLVLYVLNEAVTLLCDGSNWKIISDERIPHRCLLTNSAAQTISNSTLTIVTFDTETFDSYGMHSTSSNTGRINILRTGQYWVYAFVVFASATTGLRQVYFKVNGSYTQSTIFPISAGSETQVYMPVLVNLTAGDYVECVVWHNNGGNLNINSGAGVNGLIFGVVEVR